MPGYELEIKEHVKMIFGKLERRDMTQILIIRKKLKQVLENPYRFKPLGAPMQGLRRVHIHRSFVLTYSIDENRKAVIIEDYAHHDDVYQ